MPSKHQAKFLPHEVKLDPFTFGSEPCAVILANKLTLLNDSKLVIKISRFVCCYNSQLRTTKRCILPVENNSNASLIVKLLKENALLKINNLDMPEEIKSYLIAVVKTKAKIAIREIDELEKTQEDIYSIPDM